MARKPDAVGLPIRDRVRDLRRVRAGDLIPSAKNWRQHPPAQRAALRGVLTEIGYADALLARETPDGLMLIDGHLRAETTPDAIVPVLVLDLDEAEADMLLATLDPLAAMATANADALAALLGSIETQDAAVRAMLDGLAESALVFAIDSIDAGVLPEGEGSAFQNMTFTVHESQVVTIQRALKMAQQAGSFNGPNENSNGNALARIAEAYLGLG